MTASYSNTQIPHNGFLRNYFNIETHLTTLGFNIKIISMKLNNEITLKDLFARPVFHAAEAREAGIHPSRLSYYVKTNRIERIGHGVYRGVESSIDADFQWEDLIIIAKSIPQGVVCLVSALALYELTDEMPREHWIAVPHSTTAPKRDHTRIVRMRDIETGKTLYPIGRETVAIFDRERTIIDAFRYLSKEIAIKALKAAVSGRATKKLDIKKLQQYAREFGLNLEPYILTVTT
ncbi:TPA: type IV toxin-antitoxin system AbiEi family antitoxin domain-containing protein [Legionella pneumophila]|nr:type IV toxin-antitoxin system AbiEi family antitoxin domain-containing protein [Legionella pneumophila]HEL8431307.1 type IV toxin-antitoxin system AbiEi family antitoxin domain-containing protein [Legionella pneumophila]HEL8483547.1 type IV toxin-antitoxin system AbiEi family antitoxin domain-containing protein [Legionella pneumophila]HEL9672971.1 type IV toxin-antitoxin system AbiEi family antitoxin domain-containing protein [Legionella pneumophila]HEL9689083.1 type IV toxin-antitoxin syst